MDNSLTFIKTFTIEQFKANVNVEKLQVKKNPHTDKLFFTFGPSDTGAVGGNKIPERPVVSLVKGDSGEEFYMLHNENTGGAPVLAEF